MMLLQVRRQPLLVMFVFLVVVLLFATDDAAMAFTLQQGRGRGSSYSSSSSQTRTTRRRRSSLPPPPPTTATITTLMNLSSPDSNNEDGSSIDFEQIGKRILDEAKEVANCVSIAVEPFFKSDSTVTAENIITVCDTIDEIEKLEQYNNLYTNRDPLRLRRRAYEIQRYEMLVKLMRNDYNAYVATAAFVSPSRIPRNQLPNVQDVPYNNDNNDLETESQSSQQQTTTTMIKDDETGQLLVADCEFDDMEYQDSWLDKTLLSIFRNLVEKNTGGVTSPKAGIKGLLEQGRTYMIQNADNPNAQHKMVYDTLGGLMTPVLPPFYRIFMSGIVPDIGGDTNKWAGKQFGPWFYAPYLTSFVTPTFFKFLVGPSIPNRRKDGQLGGLVVEKCKFLQESNCKGMCLHQCKLPAQQFFQEELGLPLTVTPNFVTQECQWSFGETPLEPQDDPSFPTGCLVGCESRKQLLATETATTSSGSTKVDLCN